MSTTTIATVENSCSDVAHDGRALELQLIRELIRRRTTISAHATPFNLNPTTRPFVLSPNPLRALFFLLTMPLLFMLAWSAFSLDTFSFHTYLPSKATSLCIEIGRFTEDERDPLSLTPVECMYVQNANACACTVANDGHLPDDQNYADEWNSTW